MLIRSKVIPNAHWDIKREIFWLDDKRKSGRALKTTPEILEQENNFIANYDPAIYFNDLSCEH